MGTKRVLVIDDEPDFTIILKHGLEQTGLFKVREVTVSTEALSVARDFRPDVIILDIMMPALDGGDVALCMTTDPYLKRTPIIFLTASVLKEEVEERGGTIGGHPFLAKPVEIEELVDCIQRSLGDDPATPPEVSADGG